MPRVPTYRQQVQNTVSRTPVNTNRVTPFQTGAIQARQTQQVGSILTQFGRDYMAYAVRSEDRKDKALARDTLNKARQESREYMAKAQNLKGKDALNVYEKSKTYFEDLRTKYGESLENDNQKEYFNASFGSLSNSYLDRAISHQESERRKFDLATMDAENENAIEDAVASRYDNTPINDATGSFRNMKEKAKDIIAKNVRAANQGMGGKVIDKKIEDATFRLNEKMLSAYASDSPKEALKYLNDNWKEFDPLKRSDIKAELMKSADRQDAFETANEIVNSGKSLEDQLKMVDKIKDVDKNKLVRRQVTDRHNERQALAKLKNNKVFNDEVDKVFSEPFKYKVPLTLEADDQEHLYNLQKKLKQDALAKAGQAAAVKTNQLVYYELMSMPEDEFNRVDLRKHLKDLSGSDFQKLTDRQKRGKPFSITTPYQQLKTAVRGMDDFDVRQNGEDASRRFNNLVAAFRERLALVPEKERTEEKSNEIIGELLSPVSYSNSFSFGLFNEKAYRYEIPFLESEERERAIQQNIPENLQGLDNLQYSARDQRYYVQGDGVIKVYNLEGKEVDTFKDRSR